MPQSNSVTKALSFHPLANVTNAPVPLIDPALEGFAPLDPGISGMASGGKTDLSSPRTSRVINHAGLQDMAGTASFFGHGIAAGLLGAEATGAAGGAESVNAGPETASASAGSSAPRVAQVQSSVLSGNAGTDTLGSSGSLMPPATPEPAGGPTAPGGSAAPNATMPAAIPEPAGGPTQPGGSAYQPVDQQTLPHEQKLDEPQQKQPSTTKTVLDSVKTAAQILGPASALFAAAAGVKSSRQARAQQNQQQAPQPPPPPPTLPVFGSGKGALSAPVVERSIIQEQTARRGRQSTILTNDQNDRLGG